MEQASTFNKKMYSHSSDCFYECIDDIVCDNSDQDYSAEQEGSNVVVLDIEAKSETSSHIRSRPVTDEKTKSFIKKIKKLLRSKKEIKAPEIVCKSDNINFCLREEITQIKSRPTEKGLMILMGLKNGRCSNKKVIAGAKEFSLSVIETSRQKKFSQIRLKMMLGAFGINKRTRRRAGIKIIL
ncbi:hypothetical protein N9A04_00695 [Rickettsiales bacterium]|nr:hypothetical protein [Rickettsiales bacterium]